MNYKSAVEALISGTPITINGNKAFDIQVHNPKFYKEVWTRGSLGLGESYMQGWWDCKALDEFFYHLFAHDIESKLRKNTRLFFLMFAAKLFNFQTLSKSRKSIAHHYDIGNELYEKMLDPSMMYSCGYWKNADKLEEAQQEKLKLTCEKLHLKPGMRVLDIGCGWGGFAEYAAKNHNVKVVGITLSKEQQKLAKKRCEGLDVEIRLQDYREFEDRQFDRIVSIGMVEHVGHKNYKKFMETLANNLTSDGICFLSFIGSNQTGYNTDPWIHKYIFPNGLNPSLAQIGKAIENRLILMDFHNTGLHYDRTLLAWIENFKTAWDSLKKDYDEVFYRMWNFYLACSAAAFRARTLNLWQMVFVKPGFKNEYKTVR